MTELPEDMLQEIEQKVARFRERVTNAARKRWERRQTQKPRPSREEVERLHNMVFDLWISGLTYKQISMQTGYKLGYVATVANREVWRRCDAPEWEDWREQSHAFDEQRRLNKKKRRLAGDHH
jgi:hypothetical protein